MTSSEKEIDLGGVETLRWWVYGSCSGGWDVTFRLGTWFLCFLNVWQWTGLGYSAHVTGTQEIPPVWEILALRTYPVGVECGRWISSSKWLTGRVTMVHRAIVMNNVSYRHWYALPQSVHSPSKQTS